jgi:hypothetical protein
MKKLFFSLSLLSLLSCTNNKAVDGLIVQNNKYFAIQLEEYKLQEKYSQMDSPRNFDQSFHARVLKAIDDIEDLKDGKAYDSIYEAIKQLSYESRIDKMPSPTDSENKEVLKNSLYIQLLNAIRANKLNKPIGLSTHCRLSDRFKIVKTAEKDSVRLDFYTFNPYQLNVDYIMDGGEKIYAGGYVSDKGYKVWTVRYMPKSRNTSCHGKIFYKEDGYSDIIFLQEFDDKNALSKFPF